MRNGPFSMPQTALDALRQEGERAGLAALGLALDARAEARFTRYYDLLLEWNRLAGLTAVTGPVDVARRHFGESLALLAVLRRARLLPPGARLIDVGAGAGFPGLPMAIVDPSLRLTLLEAHGRRAGFLRLAIAALELQGVRVVHARAEDAGRDAALREAFDVAVARAVAPLAVLVELALPLLRPAGVLATPKGARAGDELAEAATAIEALGGHVEAALALVLPEGVAPQTVLVVRRAGALDARYPRRAGIPSKRPLGRRRNADGTIPAAAPGSTGKDAPL
jgi:16S rRNA (guanine527-N7)-methyltransferase